MILKEDGNGICICLSCYLGFCTGVREHTRFHYEKTGHSLFLQIHRTELPTESNASTLTRLAIEPEPPKNYETDMKVRCEACKNVFEAEGFVGQGSDRDLVSRVGRKDSSSCFRRKGERVMFMGRRESQTLSSLY